MLISRSGGTRYTSPSQFQPENHAMGMHLERKFDTYCKRIGDDIQKYYCGYFQGKKTEIKASDQIKNKAELKKITSNIPNSLSEIENPNTPDHTNLDLIPGIIECYFPVYKRGVRRPILQLVLSCDEEGFGISYFDGEQNKWIKLDTTRTANQISHMLLEKHL